MSDTISVVITEPVPVYMADSSTLMSHDTSSVMENLTDTLATASDTLNTVAQVANDNVSFFDKHWYHNTVGDWAIFLGIVVGSIIVAKMVYWLFGNVVKKLARKTKTKLDDILVDMLEEPVVLGIVTVGLYIGYNKFLSFPEGHSMHEFSSATFHILIAINITWLIARTIDALIEEYIVPLTEKSESDLDDQLMPIVKKGVRSIIWILGIIVALNNAGYNVSALIAGLGIGGLALAMAAKDTVTNIFGGITIFVDKPFKINDRIKADGFDGTVTEIGIRSTRLKTLEGRIVTVPNHKFTENSVENVSMEETRKVVLNLGMIYDTTPAQMEQSMALLQTIADEHKELILEEDTKVGFNAFGDFALGIIFIYYIRKESDILETQTTINLEILKRFNENGLEFAFPTQTLHLENASS